MEKGEGGEGGKCRNCMAKARGMDERRVCECGLMGVSKGRKEGRKEAGESWRIELEGERGRGKEGEGGGVGWRDSYLTGGG